MSSPSTMPSDRRPTRCASSPNFNPNPSPSPNPNPNPNQGEPGGDAASACIAAARGVAKEAGFEGWAEHEVTGEAAISLRAELPEVRLWSAEALPLPFTPTPYP